MGKQTVDVNGRRFFRIRDRVYLACRPAEQAIVQTDVNPLKHLPDRLSALGNESRTVFRKLAKESPEVAAAVALLDKKISALAAAVIAASLGEDDPKLQAVCLSASGVGFPADRPLPNGMSVVITLLLPPSLFKIAAQGKVVACRLNEETPDAGQYWIGVDFTAVDERDQEFLAAYVLRREAEEIKLQRGADAACTR